MGSLCSKMTSTTKLFDEKELKEAFRLFDSNNDGRISTEEFVKLIKKIGGIMTGGQAKALLTLADKDDSGNIGFEEFQSLWQMVMGELEDDPEIRKEFERFDLDKNGFITKTEMLEVIETSDGFVQDKVVEAKKWIEELDVDKYGQVSYPEFLLVWKFRD